MRRTVFGIIAAAVVFLALAQDYLIYHPQPYGPDAERVSQRPLARIGYTVPAGRQVAFYAAPASGGLPKHLWLMFGGNGGLILQYHALPEQPQLAADGILMIDYPGYGYNVGHATGAVILPAADAAFAALAQQLGMPVGELVARTGVLGHSMGTGAAMEFALAHPEVQRVMLVSPYTSLYAMCVRTAGPVALLLSHDFDNEAGLAKLAARNPRPQVDIVTGDQDQVIPIAMSRRMAAEFPWVHYTELKGYEHNHIVTQAAGVIAGDMVGME